MSERGARADDLDLEGLLDAARRAVANAYAPYSGYRVGAAVLGDDGRTYSGVNVENASYGVSCCAERAAVYHALAHGCRGVSAVAVAADGDEPPVPCGACLQVIAELGPGSKLIVAGRTGRPRIYDVPDLMPHPFRIRFQER